MSLFYDGFRNFDDIFHVSCPVPGENSILEVILWNEVNTFADRMAEPHDKEAERQGNVLDHLGQIFPARRDLPDRGRDHKRQ